MTDSHWFRVRIAMKSINNAFDLVEFNLQITSNVEHMLHGWALLVSAFSLFHP